MAESRATYSQPKLALKPTGFRYAPAVGLALRWAHETFRLIDAPENP